MRKIVRPKGRKPYLDKLEVRDGAEMLGRFCGLLLPDYAAMTGDQLIAALSVHKPHEALVLTQEIWRRLRQGEPALRYSRDLPEAEGDVFIARVPGVPIAVVGCRDPGNGELCVGGVGPDLNAKQLAEAETCCEMVTGQEAARLISLITVKLHNGWLIETDRQRVN